jgi:hypothetical protein
MSEVNPPPEPLLLASNRMWGGRYYIQRIKTLDDKLLTGAQGYEALVDQVDEMSKGLRDFITFRSDRDIAATLSRALDAGHETYVYWHDYISGCIPFHSLQGGFILRWEDAENWGERPPEAGYLEAFSYLESCKCSPPHWSLLKYAGQRIAAEGRPWLRISCRAEDSRRRERYERRGFSFQGLAPHDQSIALYERPSSYEMSPAEEEAAYDEPKPSGPLLNRLAKREGHSGTGGVRGDP